MRRTSSSPSPATRPTSTPSRRARSPPTPATATSSAASRASSAGTPWRWWCGPTRSTTGIGGHISTYASSATLYEVGFNHFFRGRGRRPAGGDLIYFQGHASPGIYARAFLEGRLTERAAGELPPRARAGRRPVVLSAPVADAGLLAVPHGLDGPRPIMRHLPGALQPLPAATAACTTPHEPQGLGLPRRRRDGRAGDARRHHARLAREARQPDLRRQLQPAAARRPGARQRQDHPGTGSRLPRRRLERHQGHLGQRLGSAARRATTPACSSSAWTRSSTASTRSTSSKPAPTSASISSASTPSCWSWSSTTPTSSCASCAAAATTRRRSTPPTRPPSSTQGRRRSSSPRRSRATAWARRARARNITHQQKKLNEDELRIFRDRFDIPISDEELAEAAFYRPPEDSPEIAVPAASAAQALGGSVPTRRGRSQHAAGAAGASTSSEFLEARRTARSRRPWSSSRS